MVGGSAEVSPPNLRALPQLLAGGQPGAALMRRHRPHTSLEVQAAASLWFHRPACRRHPTHPAAPCTHGNTTGIQHAESHPSTLDQLAEYPHVPFLGILTRTLVQGGLRWTPQRGVA